MIADTELLVEEKKARYEFFVGILAFISLIIYLLIVLDLATWLTNTLLLLDTLLNIIFFLDFLRNLRLADSRRQFFFRIGWLDLISCIPVPRILRLFRVARLFRATHILRRLGYRGVVREFLANRAESSLAGAGIVAMLLIVISSAIIVPLESNAPGANILSGDDALWWSFVTITTVGYGDRFPVTDSGRFLAAILMTVGVGLFGVLTSYLSTNFLSHDQEVDQKSLENEMSALRLEIQEMRRLIEQNKNDLHHTDSTPDQKEQID